MIISVSRSWSLASPLGVPPTAQPIFADFLTVAIFADFRAAGTVAGTTRWSRRATAAPPPPTPTHCSIQANRKSAKIAHFLLLKCVCQFNYQIFFYHVYNPFTPKPVCL